MFRTFPLAREIAFVFYILWSFDVNRYQWRALLNDFLIRFCISNIDKSSLSIILVDILFIFFLIIRKANVRWRWDRYTPSSPLTMCILTILTTAIQPLWNYKTNKNIQYSTYSSYFLYYNFNETSYLRTDHQITIL